MSARKLSSILTLLFAATLPLDAHDFWIAPTEYQPPVNTRTEFNLLVGQNLSGDSIPWIPEWFHDYRVIGPDGAKPVRGIIGDIPAGGFTPDKDAVYVAGYYSLPELAELDAEKFNSYLEAEGLEHALAQRKQNDMLGEPGNEYYSRCAKSLIKSGSGANTSALSTVIGYPLEIIPLDNPFGDGNSLRVQLLYQSKPISGLSVFAFNEAFPENVQRINTDQNGIAEIALNQTGVWLIKSVHIFEIENPSADWESFWASLTFEK